MAEGEQPGGQLGALNPGDDGDLLRIPFLDLAVPDPRDRLRLQTDLSDRHRLPVDDGLMVYVDHPNRHALSPTDQPRAGGWVFYACCSSTRRVEGPLSGTDLRVSSDGL